MLELSINSHTSRIASVAELRQKLAPFASQQFREIWVKMDSGGPILGTLMNKKFGCLLYLRHDDGDAGFTSRNPMYDESDTLGGLAFGHRFNTVRTCMMSAWGNAQLAGNSSSIPLFHRSVMTGTCFSVPYRPKHWLKMMKLVEGR
jgi:hypothetical protein